MPDWTNVMQRKQIHFMDVCKYIIHWFIRHWWLTRDVYTGNLPKILCCMVIGPQFCLRLEVNYCIQNHTPGINISLWITSMPYISFSRGHNWTTYTLAMQDSSGKTGRLVTALDPAVCGKLIKTCDWKATSADGETAHTSAGWFQKQTEQLNMKAKQQQIFWMLLIQRL